jgi:hypothetical protein
VVFKTWKRNPIGAAGLQAHANSAAAHLLRVCRAMRPGNPAALDRGLPLMVLIR